MMVSRGRTYRGEPSRPIPVWNGVLEHRDRIGEALWEFLWCLDRITEERNGIGLVFGGAPVKLGRIVADLKGDKESVRRHLKKLEKDKYIRMRRTPYGQVIEVLNSKKFGIWGKEKPQSGVSPGVEKPTYESEKPIGESEKPQSAVSKEDHAITMQEEAAAGRAAAATAWNWIGIQPCGPTPFQELFETNFANRNGHSRAELMAHTLDHWDVIRGSRPRPARFCAALDDVRRHEKSASQAEVPRQDPGCHGPRRPAVAL